MNLTWNYLCLSTFPILPIKNNVQKNKIRQRYRDCLKEFKMRKSEEENKESKEEEKRNEWKNKIQKCEIESPWRPGS